MDRLLDLVTPQGFWISSSKRAVPPRVRPPLAFTFVTYSFPLASFAASVGCRAHASDSLYQFALSLCVDSIVVHSSALVSVSFHPSSLQLMFASRAIFLQPHERVDLLPIIHFCFPVTADFRRCNHPSSSQAVTPSRRPHHLQNKGQAAPANPNPGGSPQPDASFQGAPNAQPSAPPHHKVSTHSERLEDCLVY